MARISSRTKASTGRSHETWSYSETPNPDAGDSHSWLQMRRLNKGENWNLPPFVKAIQMGLSWDKRKDVDSSVALFNERMENVGLVWYGKLKSECGSVVHSGDNVTGDGAGDDEIITIDLAKLPVHIHYLVFIVTVYTSSTVFSQVEKLEVEMRHGNKAAKGDELFKMSLSNFSDQAMLVGQLIRKGPKWNFAALGEASRGHNAGEVLQDGAIGEFLSRSPAVAVVVREISVRVLEGKNLAAKDVSFFGRDATSDPYYVVYFNGKTTKSEVQSKTLNPVWNRRQIKLGSVKEGETDILEISLFDHDVLTRDDFMGVVRVTAGELHKLGLGKHKFWFKLIESDEERYRNETVSGEILVEINVKESDVSRRRLWS